MTISVLIIVASALVASQSPPVQPRDPQTSPPDRAEVWGLQLGVSDVVRCTEFYCTALDFEQLRLEETGAVLRLGDMHLVLVRSSLPPARRGMARVHLNLSVGALEAVTRRVRDAGGRVDERGVQQSAVGPYLEVYDPAGHSLNVIDHPWDDLAAHAPYTLFNAGLNVVELGTAEPFLASLGIRVRTRDYLPKTLVMEATGAAQLVLHPLAEQEGNPSIDGGTLILSSLGPGTQNARIAGFRKAEPRFFGSGWLEFLSPSGIQFRVLHEPPILVPEQVRGD